MWNYIKLLLRDEGGWIGAVAIGGAMLYSAYKSSKTAQQAAGTQAAAANAAAQAQLEMYYQTREDLAPWREAGVWALGETKAQAISQYEAGPPSIPKEEDYKTTETKYKTKKTLRPKKGTFWGKPAEYEEKQVPYTEEVFDEEAYNKAMGEYKTAMAEYEQRPTSVPTQGTGLMGMIEAGPGEYEESPYYNFLLQEGTKALEHGAAAQGMQFSGAENKALMEYGQNLASTDYNNWLAQYYQSLTPYQSLADVGQTATMNTGTAGMQAAGGQANALLAGGQAQAAGQMGAWQPYGNLINWGGNQLLNYYMMNKLGAFNQPTSGF